MQSNGAASVAVVGCGRLGLTMALAFAQKGVNVCGVDISSNLVSAMNDRTFRSDEPSVADALRSIPVGDRRLQATTDLAAALASVETVLIAVDTPSTGGNRHYDHGKVGSVLAAINAYMRDRKAAVDGTLPSGPRQVVVCCTVMPGYLVDIGTQLLRAYHLALH
jgi:UDPglucose 6-dehydrogenase